jgi:hypothetical protein
MWQYNRNYGLRSVAYEELYLPWYNDGYMEKISPFDISVEFQRTSFTHQLTFNGLHLYNCWLSKNCIDYISWHSTGNKDKSVDIKRASTIHQLTLNLLHLHINWLSKATWIISWSWTSFIYTSVDFQRATCVQESTFKRVHPYKLKFTGLHPYINWLSKGCVYTPADFRRAIYTHQATNIHQLTFNGLHGLVSQTTTSSMIVTYINIIKPSIKVPDCNLVRITHIACRCTSKRKGV